MRYADAVGGRGRVEFSPAMVAGRALAGLLLLAGLTLPMTAQAQTTVTLVSNIGQGNDNHGYFANVDVAQAFDTGSNAAGYNLDSVQIVSSGTHRFSLAVYTTDTNRYPDTLLHSLTNPGTFALGTLVFTAPENATLDTDTTYTLVLRINNQVTFGVTGNDAEDGGRAAGWTIADDFDRKLPGGWLSSDSNAALRIAIKGSSANNPATGAPGITGTAQVGQTLTATVGDIADVEGLPDPFLTDADTSFQWIRVDGGDSDILGATASTYTLVGADQGKTIKVEVSFKDNDGYAEGPRTSAATAAVRAAAVTNRPATGAPAITGTAQVGQMLTAVTTGIMDADGLTNVSYTYQWILVDTDSTEADILGATASSYTLVGADQGKTIRVKVSFEDDDGYAEGPVTSAATAAVRAANTLATGAPAITGTAQVGQTLTADTSGIMDANGLTGSYTYQWILVDTDSTEADILGATASSYTLVGADQGKTIKVKVSFTDDARNPETLTSAATAAVSEAPNTLAMGAPGITGTAQVGQTLTATVGDIADVEGLPDPFLMDADTSFQWIRVDGGDSDISGARASSYTLMGADQGKTIKVKVSFTDDASNSETLTSAAYPTSGTVLPANTAPTSADKVVNTNEDTEYTFSSADFPFTDTDVGASLASVTIVGLPTLGTLTLSGTAIASGVLPQMVTAPELTAGSLKYQPAANLSGPARFTFRVNDGTDDSAGFNTLTIIVASLNDSATGTPGITGTAQVGQTLTATVGDIADVEGLPDPFLTDADTSFQWIRVDGGDSDILGATASTYTLVGADQGKTIKVKVGFKDNDGYAEGPRTSAATAAVRAAAVTNRPATGAPAITNSPATGAPAITGTAQVGQTLTAVTTGIMDADGLTNVSYTYQWTRVDTDSTETNISGAMASSYTLVGADQGKTIRVKVSFEDNDRYAEGPLTSAATAAVRAAAVTNSPATGAPAITGTAQVGQTLTAVTTGIMDADGLTNVSYTYQWTRVDTDSTEADILGARASSYTLMGADQGKTIKVKVSFTDDASNSETLTSAAYPTSGTVLPANTAPTSADKVVNTNEDTEYTFSSADFPFTDTDVGASLASVTIVGLPTLGTLTLSGTAIASGVLPQMVTAPELTAGSLKYQPAANLSGPARFTFRVNDGTDDSAGFNTLTIIVASLNDSATGAPGITGTAQVGQTLTATVGDIADVEGLPDPFLTDADTSFQWIRVDGGDSDILGATASTYTLVGADQGKTIKVKVGFKDNDGYAEGPRTSAATAAVRATAVTNSPATGAPAITGTAQVGQTLTAVTTGIMDADGLTNVSYTYQWTRVDTDSTETNISGATASSYTLVGADQGKTIKVKVSFSDDASNVETLTSAATAAVRAAAVTNSPATPAVGAWLARFGRTVGTHVLDAVGTRLRGAPGAESHVTVGGHRLPLEKNTAGEPEATTLGGASERALVARLWGPLPGGTSPRRRARRSAGGSGDGAGGRAGAGSAPAGGVDAAGFWADRPAGDPRLGQLQPLHVPALRQVLVGSSFRLNLSGDPRDSATPRLTAWGQFPGTTFDGRDGALTLGGDVLTGTLGVDGEWERWLGGVAVAHSRGDGSYTIAGTGGDRELENALTSIHPYLRYAVNERLDVWGVLGSGWGAVTLKPGNGATLETGTTLVMGALGGRGLLLAAADTGGFQLATRTDAMLTRTTSDAVAGLQATEADAHRLRLVLEGSREVTWPEGLRLTPAVEIGLRHDWGDAETGFGLELGGRVQYADPRLGLTIEAAVRGLLAHEDSDYGEWGASGSVRIAPGPDGQGLALTLSPTWGAASSGVEGLWSRQTAAGLVPQGTRSAPTGRLNAEVSYGVAAPFGTGLLTPYAGTVLADGAARTYRVGTRLELTGGWATGVTLSLEGQRQEPVGPQPVNQGVQFQAAWGF